MLTVSKNHTTSNDLKHLIRKLLRLLLGLKLIKLVMQIINWVFDILKE